MSEKVIDNKKDDNPQSISISHQSQTIHPNPQQSNTTQDEHSEASQKKNVSQVPQAHVQDTESARKQESRMMNFFNQEFLERKIDFKPK